MYLKVICSVDDEFGSICYNSHFFQIIIAPLWYIRMTISVSGAILLSKIFMLSIQAIQWKHANRHPWDQYALSHVVLHRISVTGTSSRDQNFQTVTNNMAQS